MKTNMIIKRGALLLIVSGMATFNATAANYYWNWDPATVSGTWNASDTSVWASTAAGAAATAAPTAGDTVSFGTTSVPTGMVTVSGSQNVANLNIYKSGFVFTSGTLFITSNLHLYSNATFENYVDIAKIDFHSQNYMVTLMGGGNFGGGSVFTNSTNGTFTLSKGTYTFTNGNMVLNVGNTGNSNSGVFVEREAVMNAASASVSNIVTIDGGLLNVNRSITGNGNHGYLSINGGLLTLNNGTITVTADRRIDINASGGTLTVKDGYLSSGSLNIGNSIINASIAATANFNGGVSEIITGINMGVSATTGFGLLNVSGGVLKIGSSGIKSSGSNDFNYSILLSGGTLSTTGTAVWSSALNMTLSDAKGGVTFDTDKDITLSGTMNGSGGLTKVGGGTLLLSGTNTYTGNTLVKEGTLEVSGGLSFVLGADGVSNTLTINSGATIKLDGSIMIDTSGAAALGDWQIINGSVDYTGFKGVSGWTETALGSGVWSLNDDYLFYQSSGLVTAIPEPSSLALLLTGATLLALTVRRR